MESCDVTADVEGGVFWLLRDKTTDSSLGSARQATVFNSVSNREHVNFARTHELLNSGRINENRGRNQSLLNNE
ncbi:MAG: hypothetical protein V7K64_03335, partial [Nostoc sp.]|uniref:hypothetical protein n=1 Tax=Nostoc sp. TaxID=1180 RepID=UPI002FFA6DBC